MTGLTFVSLYPVWPELFMVISTLMLLVIGVIKGNEFTSLLFKLCFGVVAISAIMMFGVPTEKIYALNDMFVLGRFAMFSKLAIAVAVGISLILSSRYLREEALNRFEYPILMMFATLGMFMMVSASHLLSFYIALELQSLSLYVLAAFRRRSVTSSEAGLKYFILGALSSGLILFGISLIYGFTGVLGYSDIASVVPGLEGDRLTGFLFGVMFVLSGLAFKVSAVPFHMWTPDVYEGAPTSVTAFFAMAPKLAAFAMLIRFLGGPLENLADQWQVVIIFLSVMSMAWGAFAGLAQTRIKRLLAYSSISNVGFALIGVAAATAEGYAAAMFYMVIYMITTAGIFAFVMFMRRDGRALKEISDLSGLSKTHPLMAYGFAVLMFSISGIPPLAGFFGKFFVFEVAVAEGMYALAVFGVLTSVAAFYYLRIIKVMFFDEEEDAFDQPHSIGRKSVAVLALAFSVLFILSPLKLLETARQATQVVYVSQDTPSTSDGGNAYELENTSR